MKDGILLRQVIHVIDEINFEEYEDRHAFGEIYQTILRSLQSAGNSGEFYTPRAVTDFMVQMLSLIHILDVYKRQRQARRSSAVYFSPHTPERLVPASGQ